MGRMMCIKCNADDTTCIDDMLQPHYVAEIFKCNLCDGTIEVVYKGSVISRDQIKTYLYKHSEEVKIIPKTYRYKDEVLQAIKITEDNHEAIRELLLTSTTDEDITMKFLGNVLSRIPGYYVTKDKNNVCNIMVGITFETLFKEVVSE